MTSNPQSKCALCFRRLENRFQPQNKQLLDKQTVDNRKEISQCTPAVLATDGASRNRTAHKVNPIVCMQRCKLITHSKPRARSNRKTILLIDETGRAYVDVCDLLFWYLTKDKKTQPTRFDTSCQIIVIAGLSYLEINKPQPLMRKRIVKICKIVYIFNHHQ